MKISMKVFMEELKQTEPEEAVSSEGLSPYLQQHIIEPMRQGIPVRYGEIDYEQFDDMDLRRAAGYCAALEMLSYRLEGLAEQVRRADACAVKQRVFC